MPSNEISAERVRKIREGCGWTQRALANYAGVTDRAVRLWETKGAKHAAAKLLAQLEGKKGGEK